MSEKIKVEIELDLTDDFLMSIMCTAFEVGCEYWAFGRNIVRTPQLDYISYELCDEEEYLNVEEDESEVTWFTVDKKTVAEGCRLALVNGRYGFETYILEQNAGMIDANDADCIVQLACFGEIVYG